MLKAAKWLQHTGYCHLHISLSVILYTYTHNNNNQGACDCTIHQDTTLLTRMHIFTSTKRVTT